MNDSSSISAVAGRVVRLEDLAAAAAGAVVARLPVMVVLAHGPDAAPFLHGQLANDVSGLQVGAVNLSLSLNHRGHAMAEGAVLRQAKTEVLLALDGEAHDPVLDSLRSHVIFDQVELEAQPGRALLTVQGAGAGALMPQAPEEGTFVATKLAGASVLVYRRRRSGPGGYDLLVDAADLAAVEAALAGAGARLVGAEVIDALRVQALLPTAAGEGGDGVLPQEAGLEGSLSYRKGCYLGQEIMARIEARGNLRRSLARLQLESAAVTAREVKLDGRTVGLLGTVVAVEDPDGGAPLVEALAVLRNDLPPEAQLEAGSVAVCRRYNGA